MLLRNFPKKVELLRPVLADTMDILVFGSAVKGKLFPHDVDVAVLVEESQRQKVVNKIRCIDLPPEIEIEVLTPESLNENPLLAFSIFHEGVSLKFGSFAESVGLDAGFFYFYKLAGKTKSEKNRFLHALNRLLPDLKLVKVNVSTVFVPVEVASEFESFLEQWQVENSRLRVLLSRGQVENLSVSKGVKPVESRR